MRGDSRFDSARLLFMQAEEKDRWAKQGRRFDFITQWNPRKQDKETWVAKAEAAGCFEEVRPGKRVGLLDLSVERAWQGQKRDFRLVVQVAERSIGKKGSACWFWRLKQDWWAHLDRSATAWSL